MCACLCVCIHMCPSNHLRMEVIGHLLGVDSLLSILWVSWQQVSLHTEISCRPPQTPYKGEVGKLGQQCLESRHLVYLCESISKSPFWTGFTHEAAHDSSRIHKGRLLITPVLCYINTLEYLWLKCSQYFGKLKDGKLQKNDYPKSYRS